MFSQRFIIRSMQLIGATQWFIKKPFIIRGIKNGILSSLIAIAALGFLLYFLNNRFSLAIDKTDFITFAAIAGILLAVGVIISALSTGLTVNKYLRLKLDELY